MPNWCSNVVEIEHDDRAKMVMLRRRFRQGKMCEFIHPVPQELMIVAGYLGDTSEQRKLDEATEANRQKFGYGNWYDFCVGEWGTKWDVGERGGDSYDDSGLTLSFESAWAPPTGIYEKMLAQGYRVKAYFYEPGMAFAGSWIDGVEDSVEYGGETSETVRSVIGDEVDDMFGISEAMAEWEEEERREEELYAWTVDGAEKKGLNRTEDEE